MRAHNGLLGAALLVSIPLSGLADESKNDPEADRETYLSSVMLAAEVEVCVERAPPVGEELTAAFEAWAKKNAEAIDRGEAVVRAGDLGGVSFEDYLAHLRSLAVRFYELASDQEAEAMCRARLK